MAKTRETLELWQERYETARNKYQKELSDMDRREKRYNGDPMILDDKGASAGTALHVRNVVAEMIETQVDSAIPQPKVTAVHKEDEDLARMVENMLRMRMKTLPLARIVDQAERTCPLQGGVGVLVEWDEELGSHTEMGDIRLTLLHPKKIIPQPGCYEIEEMDWLFITAERTKNYIRRRYGVDVSQETEETPDARETEGSADEEDLVTQIYAYYRNDEGGIGLIS